MSQALDHVRQAIRILATRNAMINQRLFEAAGQFQLALEQTEQWPDDLLRQAGSINQKLTARGKPDTTINGMDVSTAGQIANEMLDLARAIDAADNRRPETTGHRRVARRKSRRAVLSSS